MTWLWLGFVLFVVVMLALDLGVFHRKAHAVSVKEALIWSCVWVGLSLLFTPVVYVLFSGHIEGFGDYPAHLVARAPELYPSSPHEAALMYLTGYITEWSLSVDNIFVIALIFTYFKIPDRYQHRVLFWGILGAVVMRGIFIFVGTAAIERFHWVIYLFGAFLVFTAVKLLSTHDDPDPSKNWAVRLAYKLFPITDRLHGQKFFVTKGEIEAGELEAQVSPAGEGATGGVNAEVPPTEGRTGELPADAAGTAEAVATDAPPPAGASLAAKSAYYLTPLGLALLVVEATDLLFAVDSIPAILGITADRYIVFTSNIFAVLGLRAMYFALAGIINKFRYLQTALALILGFIGVKMLLSELIKKSDWLHGAMPYLTLGFIALALTGGVVASLVLAPKGEAQLPREA